MLAFAGYTLPVQYPSGIIKEHLHCREQVGLFDISHMGQIAITGQSAATALETLTPGDIKTLQVGQLRYTVLTNNNGGIIDDLIISRTESGFMAVVNAACTDKDYQHLSKHLSGQCQITILDKQALLALQGPASHKLMMQLSIPASKLTFLQSCSTNIANMPCTISRCGYTGEDGFEISIAQKYAQTLARLLLDFDVVKPIGLGARDTLRLEAGLGLYGHEFNESISPVEAGLTWTFRKNAAHFPGADSIRSQQQSGAKQRSVALIIEGKSTVRSNSPLYNDNGIQIGIVTSGSYSPSLKKPIALALIDSTYTKQHLIAKVRNRMINSQITPLPFMPHHYHR